MINSLYRWPIRVYYEDTDAGGVVYHARYLAFYERARTEMLRHHHYDQQQLLAQNIAFVVHKMTIDYKSPAKLDDLLEIQTTLIDARRVSLAFSQQIINQDEKVLSTAKVHIACVNPSTMRPIALPQSIISELING